MHFRLPVYTTFHFDSWEGDVDRWHACAGDRMFVCRHAHSLVNKPSGKYPFSVLVATGLIFRLPCEEINNDTHSWEHSHQYCGTNFDCPHWGFFVTVSLTFLGTREGVGHPCLLSICLFLPTEINVLTLFYLNYSGFQNEYNTHKLEEFEKFKIVNLKNIKNASLTIMMTRALSRK